MNSKILRLDLFRLIQQNEHDKSKDEFTGGQLHASKHYSIEGKSVSTGKDKRIKFDNLFQSIELLTEAFFVSKHEDIGEPKKGIKYSSTVNFKGKDVKAFFYYLLSYFLNYFNGNIY